MRRVKIGLVQIEVSNSIVENLNRAIRGIESCIKQGADFILLPEMWLAGFNYGIIKKLSPQDCQRAINLIMERTKQACIIAGSIPEIKQKIYNSAYVLEGGRILGKYRKCHLFSPMGENEYLSAGSAIKTFSSRLCRIGVMICYEIRFPEVARILALKGSKIIFVPAQFPKPRLNIWRTLLASRAIENQLFIAACNRVGASGKQSYFGHSLVAAPDGSFLAEAGEDEAELICDVDLSMIDKVRGEIQVFKDRRSKLYAKYLDREKNYILKNYI
ncbi:MAG: carbon-nitrogen family hydrolase [Methanocellales archaeon]